MTPEAMAALHRRCFDAGPRPWTAAEFAAFAADPAIIRIAGDRGFAIGRVAADEAELLTVAVAPEARRAGVATGLVRDFEAQAAARGARAAFLEVAADNRPALGLYRSLGYAMSGTRRGYYKRARGGAADALVLRRNLPPSARGKTD